MTISRVAVAASFNFASNTPIRCFHGVGALETPTPHYQHSTTRRHAFHIDSNPNVVPLLWARRWLTVAAPTALCDPRVCHKVIPIQHVRDFGVLNIVAVSCSAVAERTKRIPFWPARFRSPTQVHVGRPGPSPKPKAPPGHSSRRL